MKQEIEMTNVDIEVTPLMVQDSAAICQIRAGAGSEDKVKGGVIRLVGDGPFTLRFALSQSSVQGLKFKPAGEDAFWCNVKGCPPNKMHNSKNQFGTVKVAADGQSLELQSSPNGSRNAVHYSLGFTDGSRFDPVIIHDSL